MSSPPAGGPPTWQGQQQSWQGQQPTWSGQQPPTWGGQPQFQTPPTGASSNRAAIIAVFIGVLIAIVAIAGLFIFLNRPPAPEAPCPPGRPCAPGPSLPPISAASPTPRPVVTPGSSSGLTPVPSGAPPTPISGSPAPSPLPTATAGTDSPAVILGGSSWRSATLGYGFEFDATTFSLSQSSDTLAVLDMPDLNAQIVIEATDDDITASEMIDRQAGVVDTFMVARTRDNDDYDAVLGPGIGYVRGESAVYSGILLGPEGTPVAPGGVTVMASTDGRITVAVIIIVSEPDTSFGGDTVQHIVRDAVDDIVKSFDWGSAP